MSEPAASNPLSGPARAAILLSSLDAGQAGQIFDRLPPDAAEELRHEMASLDPVLPSLRIQVLGEFCDRACEPVQPPAPFSFLENTPSEDLRTFLQEEHPQTIALVLAHLPSPKAGEILVGLPGLKQVEVLQRIASLRQADPQVIQEVARGLEQRLGDSLGPDLGQAGGVQTVAEILNLADPAAGSRIMQDLEDQDPELLGQVRRFLFGFEDIASLEESDVRAVLAEAGEEDLALALQTASPKLKDRIFFHLPEPLAQWVRQEMQEMNPVRVRDVESAQARIVQIVHRLESSGRIVAAGGGRGRRQMAG